MQRRLCQACPACRSPPHRDPAQQVRRRPGGQNLMIPFFRSSSAFLRIASMSGVYVQPMSPPSLALPLQGLFSLRRKSNAFGLRNIGFLLKHFSNATGRPFGSILLASLPKTLQQSTLMRPRGPTMSRRTLSTTLAVFGLIEPVIVQWRTSMPYPDSELTTNTQFTASIPYAPTLEPTQRESRSICRPLPSPAFPAMKLRSMATSLWPRSARPSAPCMQTTTRRSRDEERFPKSMHR